MKRFLSEPSILRPNKNEGALHFVLEQKSIIIKAQP